MAAAVRSQADRDLDALIDHTIQRPRSVRPPSTGVVRPVLAITIMRWASSQVAAYRVGLVLGYLSMMYFGASAFIAGIPTFTFTTPPGWTPIWATGVVIGGLVAAIGSLKAGTEPMTREIRVYNRIELAGAVVLFLTLGAYSAILLFVGYRYGDPGRASIGAGFFALGVPPTVRMLWLVFRPRFLAMNHKQNGKVTPETAEQTTARPGLNKGD